MTINKFIAPLVGVILILAGAVGLLVPRLARARCQVRRVHPRPGSRRHLKTGSM